jgi:hypothetical protein
VVVALQSILNGFNETGMNVITPEITPFLKHYENTPHTRKLD